MSQNKNTPGANAERSRLHNRRVVMGQIHAAHEIGRAEIARASGLSTQAVSNIIAELQTEGFLREAGRLVQGRGLPALQYAIKPAGGFALGIEVRPGALYAAVLDLAGESVATWRLELERADPKSVCAALAGLMDAVSQKIDPGRIMGAGVVMPGPFGRTGLSGEANDLPGWQDLDPVAVFAEVLGLEVQVENDANAAAMTERVSGAARGLSTYACLYFGTGLGLGLVSDGHLVAGGFGNAGEIGQIVLGGKRLEDVASRRSAQDFLNCRGIVAGDIDALETLHLAGNPALDTWVDAAASGLSQALGIIENLFDPQTIILGGAMPAGLMDDLVARIKLPAASVSNRPDRKITRLCRGRVGRMTATHGAAALVLNRVFTPRFGPLI